MSARSKSGSALNAFELTLLILAVVAALYFAGEVLKPLALAVLLSFALAPASRVLERIGLPRAGAVALTVVITLGLLGGFGYVVGNQLNSLAQGLPSYKGNIEAKLGRLFRRDEHSTAAKLSTMAKELSNKLDNPAANASGELPPVQRVEIVKQPDIQSGLNWAGGPQLEYLVAGSFVLVLVLFILVGRDDLSDRLVGLFGSRHVSLTTRTMDEIARRISRYLATFALVNSGFGLIIGLGLAVIGLPFAALWGCLAAALRFIPYVGSAVAFALPMIFGFAYFPGWVPLLEIAALFGMVEIALNSFLEPIIYGKTTGVTALGLLVSAMFWTWLWGTLGLLLSTPLTVCLAVLGKYVPSLDFFAILLGEEAELKPDVRLYQRLVALDRDGAIEVVESELKGRPRVEVFDEVLVPALSRAGRDAAQDELDDTEEAFVWQVIGDVLGRLEGTADVDLASAATSNNAAEQPAETPSAPSISLVGLAAQDTSEVLVLRMLGQLLAPSGVSIETLTDTASPLQVVEEVAELSPKLVIVSNLMPQGLTMARYLVRRVRARSAEIPVVLGLWGESGKAAPAAARTAGNEATRVVVTLAEARDRILRLLSPAKVQDELPSPVTA